MSIVNYFFIGFVFAFLCDLLLQKLKKHPRIKKTNWGWKERTVCIIIWPISIIIFFVSLFQEFFRK